MVSCRLLLVMLVALASGCGGGTGSQTLQFVGPEEPATFQPIIAGFEAKHPGVRVKYTQVPFDQLNNVLQQRLSAKDAFIDVYTVDQPRVAALATRGFLTDLSDLSERVKAAMIPGQYDVNAYDGKLWALPIWTSDQFLFYNTALLRKAGVTPPPRAPDQRWTWEQTIEAGKRVKASTGAPWAFIPEQVEQFYQLQAFAESLGGGSGITGPDMLTPAVTTDGWRKAMAWYHELFARGLAPRGVGSFQTTPLFVEGKVAFFAGGPWDVGRFAGAKGLDWGLAPLPYFRGGKPVTPTGSWSWGINPASKQRELARSFLEYASLDPAGNLLTTRNSTIIPANLTAMRQYVTTLESLGGQASKGVGVIIADDAKHTAVARPRSVGYIQFEEVMTRVFADIRNGAEPGARLDKAMEEIRTAWARLR